MLKSISNINQLHDLISAFKARNKKYHTNLLLPHDRLENLINRDKVLYQNGENCLSFLIRQYHTNMLYLYVNDQINIEAGFDEKPLYIEFYEQPDKINNWIRPLEEKGFLRSSSYLRMSASNQTILFPESCDEKRFKIITDTDKERIKEIMFSTFDLVGDRLPEEWEYDDFFSNMYMLQAIDEENDKFAGFFIYSINNTMGMGEYIFVEKEYRKLGLAQKFFEHYHKQTVDKLKRYFGWVLTENIASISLCLSLGYKQDLLRKELYVKN